MRRHTSPLPPIHATSEQVAAVQSRLRTAANASPGFYDHFPAFGEAIDRLPDLDALGSVVQELVPAFFDALVDAGVDVPPEHWRLRGVEHLYRHPRKTT